MAKTKPSQIAKQLDYDINAAVDFAANLLEEVNNHNLAAVLGAVSVEQYDLACEFIKIEQAHREAGHLTTELYARRNELYKLLEQAMKAKD
jgi:hypothetical protein